MQPYYVPVGDEVEVFRADLRATRDLAPAFDRVLATRFGLHAMDAVTAGAWGTMVALQGTNIVRVPLSDATAQLKLVTPERYGEAEVFFG